MAKFLILLLCLGIFPMQSGGGTQLPSSPASLSGRADKSTCKERMIWAITAGQKPIYNNRIFSKALPYFVRFVGVTSHQAEISDAIGNALQNALTQWGSSLLAIRKDLDDPLRKYVESMLLCEEGHCTYTAPPAVQMDCQENAAMIIIVYEGTQFPAPQQWVAGMAKSEGRTILLNAHDFNVLYDQRLFSTWSAKGDLNLTPVLVHELGHSFGLVHSTVHGSIMQADLSDQNARRFATPLDGAQFAQILRKVVDGGVPGDFQVSECQGVYVGRPPKN
jgi:predicted Zn-dependent protease